MSTTENNRTAELLLDRIAEKYLKPTGLSPKLAELRDIALRARAKGLISCPEDDKRAFFLEGLNKDLERIRNRNQVQKQP